MTTAKMLRPGDVFYVPNDNRTFIVVMMSSPTIGYQQMITVLADMKLVTWCPNGDLTLGGIIK